VGGTGPVVKLYEQVLARDPDAVGLNFWQQLLNQGSITLTQLQTPVW
jgi:hypothetical protein